MRVQVAVVGLEVEGVGRRVEGRMAVTEDDTAAVVEVVDCFGRAAIGAVEQMVVGLAIGEVEGHAYWCHIVGREKAVVMAGECSHCPEDVADSSMGAELVAALHQAEAEEHHIYCVGVNWGLSFSRPLQVASEAAAGVPIVIVEAIKDLVVAPRPAVEVAVGAWAVLAVAAASVLDVST